MLTDKQLLEYLKDAEKMCRELQLIEGKQAPNLTNLLQRLNRSSFEPPPSTDDFEQTSTPLKTLCTHHQRKKTLISRMRSNVSNIKAPVQSRACSERDFLNDRIKDHLSELTISLLEQHNIKKGKVAEIGATRHSAFLPKMLPRFKYQFLNLDKPKFSFVKRAIQADITHCPHIPDESFDLIVSISVFEHVDKPWLAADEITRLLKPGGITLHLMPFSYFYHEAPIDYWRFSPPCVENLFNELECLHAKFFSNNRRRDNRGSKSNPIDGYGGAQFKLDGFGGWRENWHTIYAGRKPF